MASMFAMLLISGALFAVALNARELNAESDVTAQIQHTVVAKGISAFEYNHEEMIKSLLRHFQNVTKPMPLRKKNLPLCIYLPEIEKGNEYRGNDEHSRGASRRDFCRYIGGYNVENIAMWGFIGAVEVTGSDAVMRAHQEFIDPSKLAPLGPEYNEGRHKVGKRKVWWDKFQKELAEASGTSDQEPLYNGVVLISTHGGPNGIQCHPHAKEAMWCKEGDFLEMIAPLFNGKQKPTSFFFMACQVGMHENNHGEYPYGTTFASRFAALAKATYPMWRGEQAKVVAPRAYLVRGGSGGKLFATHDSADKAGSSILRPIGNGHGGVVHVMKDFNAMNRPNGPTKAEEEAIKAYMKKKGWKRAMYTSFRLFEEFTTDDIAFSTYTYGSPYKDGKEFLPGHHNANLLNRAKYGLDEVTNEQLLWDYRIKGTFNGHDDVGDAPLSWFRDCGLLGEDFESNPGSCKGNLLVRD